MASAIPNPKSIDYLVLRKFPEAKAIITAFNRVPAPVPSGLIKNPSHKNQPHIVKQRYDEVMAYEKKLWSTAPEEIENLFIQEHAKENEERRVKAEKEEQERFFNKPSANADFDFWSKAKHWTLDEAIALCFGKSPVVVNWKVVSPSIYASSFAAKYAEVRDLALRAKVWQELFDPVLPGIFIGWARRLDIDFPNELEEKVIARGGNIGDWKTNFDILKHQHDTLQADYSKLCKQLERLKENTQELVAQSAREFAAHHLQVKEKTDELLQITQKTTEAFNALAEERNNLYEQVQELQQIVSNNTEKPLHPKERISLHKLILGMAVDAYGYDPKASRSPTAAGIASDLRTRGISIDEDTVRNMLSKAKESIEIQTEEKV